MPDLKTQLGDYLDHVVKRMTVEDIFELEADTFELGADTPLVQPVEPRTPPRNRPGWLYGTAAALPILLVGVLGFLAANQTSPDGEPNPSPSATPEPPAGPGDCSAFEDWCQGTHSLSVDGVPLSFTVSSSGWELYGDIHLSKSTQGPQGAEALVFWSKYPEGTNASSCTSLLTRERQPSSVADLAAVVAGLPEVELVSGPSDVSVGGIPAKHVAVIVRQDGGCDPGFFFTWRAKTGGAFWDRSQLGDTINVWIVDLDGTHFFIAGETHPDAPSYVAEEIQEIVDSIRFDNP